MKQICMPPLYKNIHFENNGATMSDTNEVKIPIEDPVVNGDIVEIPMDVPVENVAVADFPLEDQVAQVDSIDIPIEDPLKSDDLVNIAIENPFDKVEAFNIPMEGGPLEEMDVIDSEFQQVDLEAMETTVDALYKDDPFLDEKRKASKRRRLYNILLASIGFIALIVLIATLVSSSKQSSSETSKNNQAGTQNTKDDVDTTKTKGETSQFTCASTILTCPNELNGTWTKLPADILGESSYDYAGFATAVSCDGSILAVSSLGNNNNAGHVRVFQWNDNKKSWKQMGTDIDATSNFTEFGYSLTISADGLQIAIGSRKNDEKAVDAGEVVAYAFISDAWIQIGQDLQGEFGGDNFGRSVSLSSDGKRLAVGASNNNGTDQESGHARVFQLLSANGKTKWIQLGQDLDGEMGGDQFGRSIALSGNGYMVAIGGHTHDGASGLVDAGQVRVFEYIAATGLWTQVANDIEGVKEDEYFGIAVAMSFDGSRLAVGSPQSDAYMFGVTRVFELVNGAWMQLGSNLKGGGSAIDMSQDGKRIVIGSDRGFGNGMNSGHMAVYEYSDATSAWSQVGEDINGNVGERSATSVAISADGKRVVSSSPSSSVFNVTTYVGRLRIFDYC
jgi:FG-GAP repeat